MNSFKAAIRLLVLFCALPLAGALAQQNLKINFVPERQMEQGKQKGGFDEFPVPFGWETEPGPPVTKTFGAVSVTISGFGKEIPKKMPTDNAPIICRFRSLSKEQEAFKYSPLFRSWVGAPDILSIGIKGLKPSAKYRVKFFVYDYTSPDMTEEKKGSMSLHDAQNKSVKPVPVIYSKSTEPTKGSLDDLAFILETKADSQGELLLAAKRETTNPIVNGFEIQEIP